MNEFDCATFSGGLVGRWRIELRPTIIAPCASLPIVRECRFPRDYYGILHSQQPALLAFIFPSPRQRLHITTSP